MADNNKYINLNGLKYFTRKLDEIKANIESPEFTGTPTAPTASIGDKTNQIATTEYVQKEFHKIVKWDNAEEGTTVAVSTNMVVLTEEEYESLTQIIPNTFYFIYDDAEAVDYDL